MRLRVNQLQKPSPEDGFTIIEVLAALTVISFCGLLMTGFVSSMIRLGDRARQELSIARDLLRLDGEIRALVSAVAIPYWERKALLEAGASGLSIPWYGGRADHALRFVRRDDAFAVEFPAGEAARFPGIIKASGTTESLRVHQNTTVSLLITVVEVLRDSQGIPYGLDISYQYQGRPGHTAARFSTLPLEVEEP
jgi:prepilin-type N-terminal cleavage/methylation domain-containing protein